MLRLFHDVNRLQWPTHAGGGRVVQGRFGRPKKKPLKIQRSLPPCLPLRAYGALHTCERACEIRGTYRSMSHGWTHEGAHYHCSALGTSHPFPLRSREEERCLTDIYREREHCNAPPQIPGVQRDPPGIQSLPVKSVQQHSLA
jgi:hypothetical protein